MRQAGSGIAKCLLRACYRALTIKTKLIENYYFSTQCFLITGIFIIIDFTIGFYGQVSSAENRKDHFASPLPACHLCLIQVVVNFTSLNLTG